MFVGVGPSHDLADRAPEGATREAVVSERDGLRDARELIELEKIGTTFQECTVRSDENLLEVDSATWGGMRHMRENTPWKQMERSMKDHRAYVRDHLGRLCHWHRWQ